MLAAAAAQENPRSAHDFFFISDSNSSSPKLKSLDGVGVDSRDKNSGVERSVKIGAVNFALDAAAADVRSACKSGRGGSFHAMSVDTHVSRVEPNPSLPPNIVADAAEAEMKGLPPEVELVDCKVGAVIIASGVDDLLRFATGL